MSQGGESQHLVQAGEDTTICGALTESNFKRADSPGPFTPICERCQAAIQGNSVGNPLSSGQTYADIRDWLADEIGAVQYSEQFLENTPKLRKSKVAAIVEHIKQLRSQVE